MACRTMCGQEMLIRIVNENGTAVLDMEKKHFGRGAYICQNPECIKKAQKRNILERHLKCNIPEELYEQCGKLVR